ncbi:kelch repeat and BTB domain-containing protein 8-like [Branchiostoma floridae]|uniref:Kelch repeat and BTB domain-containing protein 8-like n=1 Tax=Branchiostoma floridae TaxID=7739 RepID=A0A9J7HGB0_BRAFL|nr:kelch repeat and BTB domain-containing protein 8-like [Branchiostoma floridae]
MFTSDMAESRQKTVVLQDLSAAIFGEILRYIYSGNLNVSMDKVQPLYQLQAASLLQLDYVRDTCSSYMAMNVEGSNCVNLYKFADVFSVDIVRKTCLQFICRNFVEIASSEKFCSLSVSQLTEIISHDDLDIKEETTVWEAVVRWVQHNREDRLQHLPSILPHIRFNLLTSGNIAAILEHPLVREDPGSSKAIRNVVKKRNPNLKPRLGMTMEMAILSNTETDELLFMNPQQGRYISCSYKPEDIPEVTALTATNDNNIYILVNEYDGLDQLYMFRYNHAENFWGHGGISKVSKFKRVHSGLLTHWNEFLVEVDHVLYYGAADLGEGNTLVRMRKYNWQMDQWQGCSQLQIDGTESSELSVALSCGAQIYFIMTSAMHRYDPSQDCWCERTPPNMKSPYSHFTAVAMGTKIFYTYLEFTQMMVYDTDSDRWQKLQGWPNPGNRSITHTPSLFVLENQLHILLEVYDRDTPGLSSDYLVYVYDRSADAWRDLKATLPKKEYIAHGPSCPVARMYLPYLRGAQKHITAYACQH